MKKEMRKVTRLFVLAMAVIMIGSVFAQPEDVSAATAYTAKRVTNVKVVKKTYNSVKLTWNKVSGTKYYQVYRATSKNGKYKLIKTTKNNYFTNSKLTTGKYYYYKIRGYKKVNGKKRYTKYSYKFKTYPRLTKPTVKTSGSTTGVTVSWNKIAGADGYEIYRAAPGGNYTKVKTITASTVKLYGAKCTDTSGEAGKTYSYKVRAYRKVNGNKRYSYFSSVKKNTKKLKTPTLNTAKPVGTTRSVVLSWDSVPKATKYIVYRSTAGGSYTKVATTTSATYTDTKRDYNTTYGYYIKAYRTVNNTTKYSANSYSKTATVKMDTTTVKVTSTGLYSVALSWNQIQGAEGYKVYAKEGENGTYSVVETVSKGATTSTTISDLKANTTYYFKVAGTATQYRDGSTVTGNASNIVSTTTALAAPVAKVKTITEDSVSLSWAKVLDAEYYIVLQYDADNSEYTTIDTMTENSYTITGLEAGKEYKFKVRAVSGEYKTLSDAVTATVGSNYISSDTTVKNLKAVCGETSITLSWSEVEAATAYDIAKKNSSGTYEVIATTANTTYTITGLSKETSYCFKVRPKTDSSTGTYTAITAATCDPYTEFHEKTDCYLQYGDVKIWIGETWTDAVNASLNEAAGGSGAIYCTAKRTYGSSTIKVYCYDTVDYDEFLMVYVNDGKIAGWMTNRENGGNFEGTDIIMNTVGSKYDSLGDTEGYYLCVNTYTEKFSNDTVFTSGNAILGGIQHIQACTGSRTSLAQEEKIAMHMVNALRKAHDLPILEYSETLYGTENGVGTLAYAKTMAMSDVCSHSSSKLTIGPLAGTSMSDRMVLLGDSTNDELVTMTENASEDFSSGEVLTWRWYISSDHKHALMTNEASITNYTAPCYMAVAGYTYNGNTYWAFQTAAVKK